MLHIYLRCVAFSGGSLDDGRIESGGGGGGGGGGGVSHSHGQQIGPLGAYSSGAPRSNSSTSSSPPVASSASVVVPQPVSASKMAAPTNGGGGGRKYQCKMCPQVGTKSISAYLIGSVLITDTISLSSRSLLCLFTFGSCVRPFLPSIFRFI